MGERLYSVKDYVADARVILLDEVSPYRYSPGELLVAFNTALADGSRLRADLFLRGVPCYDEIDGTPVPVEPQFRLAFVYGIVAHALLREDEDVSDQRAASFLKMGQDVLTGVRAPPPMGGRGGKQ